MKYWLFSLVVLTLLFSTVFAVCNKPTFANQDINIVSNSCYYVGNGTATIDMNFINVRNATSKTVYLKFTGLDNIDANITNIYVNGNLTSFTFSNFQATQSIKWNALEGKNVRFNLNWNKAKIGVGREFNIQLVDAGGVVIADLDPFITSWNYRELYTLKTSSMSLSADITNDHVIYLNSTSADTNFWRDINRSTCGADIRFADLNNNLYKWSAEDLNCDTNTLNAWIGIPDTYPKNSDLNFYRYYGNPSATSDQNASGSYPSGYVSAYHMKTGADAKGVNNGTVTGATQTTSGKIGSAYSFDGNADYITLANESNFDFLTVSNPTFTIMSWLKTQGTGAQFTKMGITGTWEGIQLDCRTSNGNFDQAHFQNNGSYWYGGTANTTCANNSYHLVTTVASGNETWTTYVDTTSYSITKTTNGVQPPNANTSYSALWGARNSDNGMDLSGSIDEGRVFNYALSSDEIKLLYNVENQNSTYLTKGTQESASFSFSGLRNLRADTNAVVDLNANSDLLIRFDLNVNTASDLNFSKPLYTYYQMNSNLMPYWLYEGNIGITGYNREQIAYTSVNSYAGDINNLRSVSEDDHAFLGSSYNTDADLFKSTVGDFNLDGSNNWAKVLFTNVWRDTNTYYNLSIGANWFGSPARTMNVYDCNASTTTPQTSTGCLIYSLTSGTDTPDPDGYWSLKNISKDNNIVIADKNVLFGTTHHVYLNCPNCNNTHFWSLKRLTPDVNSNTDQVRNQTSTTGVANLTSYAKTFDAHYHFLDLKATNSFKWFVQGYSKSTGLDVNSSVLTRMLNLGTLAPEFLSFQNPNARAYAGTIDVNAFVLDVQGNADKCDFNLLNSSGSYVSTISTGVNAVNGKCSTTLNTTLYADGNYDINGIVYNASSPSYYNTFKTDGQFIIDNNAPSVSIFSPNASSKYDKASVSTVTVIFTVKEPQNNLIMDLNYDSTNQIFADLNAYTSIYFVCDTNNITVDTNCTYVWNIASVPNGLHSLKIRARSLLQSATYTTADFNFYTTTTPTPVTPTTNPAQARFINPNYDQRDSNIYYNPKTSYFLSETEKQTLALKGITSNIYVIGVIIVIGFIILAVLLWRKN